MERHIADALIPADLLRQLVTSNVQESMALKQSMLNDAVLLDTLVRVGQKVVDAVKSGNKIFFFGNGGSAADAQHLAAELMGRFEQERRPVPANALTANPSNLTAIGNDNSYEAVFARQVEGLGKPGDVAVGISTSGKSPNVLNALRCAKALKLVTVGMTGQSANGMAGLVDYCITVPSGRTARVQEAHVLVGHILCEIVERALS